MGHTVVLKMVYFLGIEYSCCLICTLCSLTPKRLLWARTLDPDVRYYFGKKEQRIEVGQLVVM